MHRIAKICLAGALLALTVPVAQAESLLTGLAGTWSGNGQVRLANGATEALKCNAYYTAKEDDRLGLAIRCASSSYKFEFRAQIAERSGRVSGTWEERTFNASGDVTGQVTPGRVTMAVAGGVSATMSVGYSRSNQTVAITAENVGFKSVNIALAR